MITCQILQKKLYSLIEMPNSLEHLLMSKHGLHKHTLNFLEKTQECFDKKIEKINHSFLTGIWNFFDRGKTNQMLEQYREHLIQSRLELLHLSIQLLNLLVKKIPERQEKLKDYHIQNIEKLLSHVFTWSEKIDCRQAIKEELKIIQKKLNAHLSPPIMAEQPAEISKNHAINQITVFMQKLHDGKSLEKNEQTLLFYYIENLALGLPEAKLKFKQTNQHILNIAKTQLEQTVYHIDCLIENGKVKHDQTQYILQLGLLIKALGTEEDQQFLSRQIELVLIDYLEKCQIQYNQLTQALQEHFVIYLGSEQQKLLIDNITKIKSNKEQYTAECKKYLCALQESSEKSIHAHIHYFQKQTLKVDVVLFEYLRQLSKPALTNAQLKIFTNLRDKMIIEKITNISEYQKLTQQEKVLLGLNSSTPFLLSMSKQYKINMARTKIINASTAIHLYLSECDKDSSIETYLIARKKSRDLLKNVLQQIPELRSQLINQNDKLDFCFNPTPPNSSKTTFSQSSYQHTN